MMTTIINGVNVHYVSFAMGLRIYVQTFNIIQFIVHTYVLYINYSNSVLTATHPDSQITSKFHHLIVRRSVLATNYTNLYIHVPYTHILQEGSSAPIAHNL